MKRILVINLLLLNVAFATYYSYQVKASRNKIYIEKIYSSLPESLKPYAFIYRTNSGYYTIRICLSQNKKELKTCLNLIKKYFRYYRIVPCSEKKLKTIFGEIPKSLIYKPSENKRVSENKNIYLEAQRKHMFLNTKPNVSLKIIYQQKIQSYLSLARKNREFEGYVHKPFENGKCYLCHKPHSSKFIALLKFKRESKEANKVCLSCHKSYCGKKGICLDCHNPHFSKKSQFRFRRFIHKPFKEQKCEECHKQRVINTACLSCHQNVKRKNQPFSLTSFLSCSYCHNPHGSDYKARLYTPSSRELCLKCHKKIIDYYRRLDYKGVYDKSYKGYLVDCKDCHNIHSGPNYTLLKEGEIATCLKCHGGCNHPMGIPDPRNGSPITCVTCHNPMGSRYKYYLRYNGKKELCVQCHKKRG